MNTSDNIVISQPVAAKPGLFAPLLITVLTALGAGFWYLYAAWLNSLPPEMLSDPSWFFLCH